MCELCLQMNNLWTEEHFKKAKERKWKKNRCGWILVWAAQCEKYRRTFHMLRSPLKHWPPYGDPTASEINWQDGGHRGIDWLIKANVLLINGAALLTGKGKVKQHVLFTRSGSLVGSRCRLQRACDNSVIALIDRKKVVFIFPTDAFARLGFV